ncbi:MAG: WhiB family transcriptional regulator, redox-sensing transcriptional regulator [Actinomycetota bacterium]|nr:WhiB family transcriptional regulator, redox-sensing transcriptional regulator [Actinomycetota bacterium]
MTVVEINRWVQQDWMSEAACKDQTTWFFAPHGEQADARERREAVAMTICRSCDVMYECRDYARRNREQGFWGGENDEERVEARRRARRAAERQIAS